MSVLLRACGVLQTRLLQCVAELKDLSFSFHLPHTQLAADLCGGRAQSLQGEGAVKSSLTATPHLVEWDLLEGARTIIMFFGRGKLKGSKNLPTVAVIVIKYEWLHPFQTL